MKIRSCALGIAVSGFALVTARAADTLPVDLTAGKKIHTGKCARCHKLYDPSAYDDRTWNIWMLKMKDKTKLNDDQFRQLNTYLQTLRSRN